MNSKDEIVRTESQGTISRLAVLSFRLSLVLPAYILLCMVFGMITSALLSSWVEETPSLDWIAQGVGLIMTALGVVAVLAVPVGFVIGIVALIQISRSGGRLRGRKFAIIGIAVTIIIGILGYRTFLSARESARAASCMSNLKQIGSAVQMYAEEHKGLYPPPEKWNDALYPYIRNRPTFRCPSADTNKASYAMNSMLKGKRAKGLKDPHNTVVMFDSVPGNNLAGGPELLPMKPRHHGYNILFADGRVRKYSLQDVRKLMVWR